MKILIDILTPKQCMLFAKLAVHLRKRGHQVYEVSRDYREVNQMLQMKGITARVVGRHGGKSLRSKLEASAQRTLELASIVAELEPDVAVSFSSPEISRVAFGIGIPHVCVNDSPHSEFVAKLTVPLATLLLTPKVIPKRDWVKFGIQSDRIIQYNAIDPWAWLKGLKPDGKILKQLGLEESKPIVVFRTEETFASYLLGKTSKTPRWMPLLDSLLKSTVDLQAVVVPRYEDQVAFLTQALGDRATVCMSTIDTPSLLSYASVFVGAGGTMTAEAALLGVPAFSCYPDKPYLIEEYLAKKGLVFRETNSVRTKTKVLKTLKNIERVQKSQKMKARKLTDSFEDPVQIIGNAVEKVS